MVGAGSAGIGVAQALHSAMVEAGTPGGYKAAASNFMVFDKDGLVGRGRRGLTEEVMVYARADLPDGMGIAAAIEQEIRARCGRDVGEMWGRCGGDVGEIWGDPMHAQVGIAHRLRGELGVRRARRVDHVDGLDRELGGRVLGEHGDDVVEHGVELGQVGACSGSG